MPPVVTIPCRLIKPKRDARATPDQNLARSSRAPVLDTKLLLSIARCIVSSLATDPWAELRSYGGQAGNEAEKPRRISNHAARLG